MASTSTSSTDSLAPVSREQAFLESFFQCLNKNVYDKAKDLCVSNLCVCKKHWFCASLNSDLHMFNNTNLDNNTDSCYSSSP